LNRHAQLASAAVSTLNKCWSGTSKTAPCFELSDGPFFRPPQDTMTEGPGLGDLQLPKTESLLLVIIILEDFGPQ